MSAQPKPGTIDPTEFPKIEPGCFDPGGDHVLVVLLPWESDSNAGEDDAIAIDSVEDAFALRPAFLEGVMPDLDGKPTPFKIRVKGPFDAQILVESNETLREHVIQLQVCEQILQHRFGGLDDQDRAELERLCHELAPAEEGS